MYKQEETVQRMHVFCEWQQEGEKITHCQAEEPTAWTAVMLDHMRAMDFAKHHERHSAGWPHGLSFYRPIGTSPQLTKKVV